MLNVNISFGMVVALNNFMLKFQQSSHDWEEEDAVDTQGTQRTGNQTNGFKFVNNLGISLKCMIEDSELDEFK